MTLDIEDLDPAPRQWFPKWLIVIRNRLFIWHLFVFRPHVSTQATETDCVHRDRLRPVCVPLGVHTCLVSCEVSPQQTWPWPGERFDQRPWLTMGCTGWGWCLSSYQQLALQPPGTVTPFLADLYVLPSASWRTGRSSCCCSMHPSSLLSGNGKIEFEEECICRTLSKCEIGCVVKLAVSLWWQRIILSFFLSCLPANNTALFTTFSKELVNVHV